MIPEEKELLSFIEQHEIVNFSIIARHFDIKNSTVSDLIDLLLKKKLVIVKKLGGSKIVMVKKK